VKQEKASVSITGRKMPKMLPQALIKVTVSEMPVESIAFAAFGG